MSLHLITAPDDDVVSVDETRAQLRLPSDITDAMIEAMIAAAVAQIDPASGGWLGRAIRPQTWELRLDGFPCGAIALPYPPLLTVDSVKYDDADGVEQTMVADTDYRMIGGGTRKSQIVPAYNADWPVARSDFETVRVRFTAGYEVTTTTDDDLPAPIKQAVMLMVKHLSGITERNLFISAEDIPGLGSRQFVVSENAAKVMQSAAEGMLASYRVYD